MPRLVYLDALRVLIVSMVIVHHAAQAYGPTGGFWPVEDSVTSDWFIPFYTVNAAVGLGLLFLLAGYFLPPSYDRKGSRRFIRERWARIGVPLVFFVLAVHLPLVYFASGRPEPLEFLRSLYDGGWQGAYLHLWFLGHLLLYSAVYVLWARLRGSRGRAAGRAARLLPPPGHAAILAFVIALVAVTWTVRWWFPVDDWVPLLFVLAAEPANMAQYVSLFVLGILAWRNDWLARIPRHVGAVWLVVGLAAAAGIYLLEALGLWFQMTATGGPDWRSAVRVSLEILVCAGLSVGLVVVLREVVRRPNRMLSAMAAASYAAYILHIFVVTGLQAALLGVLWPVMAKFAAVAVLGVVLSFGIAHLSGRVPGLRLLLGTAGQQHETRGGRREGRAEPGARAEP